ncbi:uncharacterized protein LOC130893899 isoform X2 [Diorhabda carinulata]|uniref:uncharacterized protein LOC130893899 isoform X2 n=1 Tax=Diorhabda carinulata TaxID=1163345 RepID=UPI0025A29EC0|nr:uncharacterized protein LOC130893899 isoform X2 [Diorhabda carinulata]
MYTFISDFEVFGKPTDFDRCNKAFNRYAKIHFVYLELLIWTIILTSNIFKTQKCKLENQIYNMNEVCGLFSYTWMPFDIDYSPIRELYLLFEIFGAHHIYMLAGLMAWQVFETMQHIIIRIRHVKHVMVEAFTYRDSTVRRRKFNIAVRYHNSIFGLEEKLNDAFSIFMFTHMVLTAAVLGIGIYSWLRIKSLSTFMVCTGWFVGLFMDCFSGQRLQDETHHLYMLVGLMAWQVFEVVQHIVVRIRDIKHVILEALSQEDPLVRKKQFHFAIRYHNALFGLVDRLNEVFSIFMFTHMVVASIIMGIGAFTFLHSKSLTTIMVCTGWFWGLFMDCISGQRLQDESSELAVAVYNAPWYECNEELKKDILFVLYKCQKCQVLYAGAFGIMDRPMFLAVLKLTYSYITLLGKAK